MVEKHQLPSKTSKTVLFVAALLILSHSLHLHDSTSNYVEYLMSEQHELSQNLNDLSSMIRSNTEQLQPELTIDQKIAHLENSLREQRLVLSDIALGMANEELEASEWVCPEMPEGKKVLIANDLVDIDDDLDAIENVLEPLKGEEAGDGIDAAEQQIDDSKQTADLINGLLVAPGTEVPLSDLPEDELKTNLNAPNWVLDGANLNDINDDFENAAKDGSLKLCPLERPFSVNGQCKECAEDEYFSMRTEQCIVCEHFNQENHVCEKGVKTNYEEVPDRLIVPIGGNIDDYIEADNQKEGPQCPQTEPFFDGSQCIECESFFDLESKQCTECSGSNIYDPETHTCLKEKLPVTNLEAGATGLIIPSDKSLSELKEEYQELSKDKELVLCPEDKPYYNGVECISCDEGLYFSMEQNSCGTCPSEAFFNAQTSHCEPHSFYSNLNDPNWVSDRTLSEIEEEINEKKEDPLFKQCPIDQPFSTGKQCIDCEDPEHFDYDKKQCQKCYNGQTINSNLHKCDFAQENYQTNPETAPRLIYEGKPKNQWVYEYQKNIENNDSIMDCPEEVPYFDGHSCIICPQELPYFNLEYRQCQRCQEGSEYSETHHECLTTSGNIVSQVPTLEKMAAGIFA